MRTPTCKRTLSIDAEWVQDEQKSAQRGTWVGSAVTLYTDLVAEVQCVIVDVVVSRTCEITHAIVAIDLGWDFPTLYQPIRVSMLRPTEQPGLFSVQASSDALAEKPPGFVKYEANVIRSGRPVKAPFPQSARIH